MYVLCDFQFFGRMNVRKESNQINNWNNEGKKYHKSILISFSLQLIVFFNFVSTRNQFEEYLIFAKPNVFKLIQNLQHAQNCQVMYQNKITALNGLALISTLSVKVHTEITAINHHPERRTLFRAIILIAVSNDFHLLTVCVTELLTQLQSILLKHPPENSPWD